MIFYYKEMLEDDSVRYCATTVKRNQPSFEEISRQEYEAETAKMFDECYESITDEDFIYVESYEELVAKNADLEKENAALLFQILTGEEYVDV